MTETTASANEVPVPRWIIALLGVFHRFTGSLRGVAKAVRQDWHWNVTRPLHERAARKAAYFSEMDATDQASGKEAGKDEAEDTKPMKAVGPDEEADDIKGSGPPERPGRRFRGPVAAVALALIVLAVAIFASRLGGPKTNTQAHAETTATVKPAVATKPSNEDMVAKTNAILKANGWKPPQFKLAANVDESQDHSTAGNGAFTTGAIHNPAEMVAFLKSGENGAVALKAAIMAGSDGTEAEVLDTSNWIAVQATVDFTFPCNTSLHGATVVSAGPRGGSKGDIFLIFASPSSGKAVAVRGACGNAQVVIPRPVKFVPPARPPGRPPLQAKNGNENPYPRGNAPRGGGPNANPGPGTQTPRPPNPPPTYNPPAPPPPPPGPPAGSQPDPAPAPPPAPSIGQDPPNNGRVPSP